MKKLHCVTWGKYRKYKNPKISFICRKCENEDEIIFNEEEPIEIFKTPGLLENI